MFFLFAGNFRLIFPVVCIAWRAGCRRLRPDGGFCPFRIPRYGEVPEESKEELKGILTEDEYRTVSGDNVSFRFKYLKFLNKYLE